mmetsp:Transcript_3552/g.4460  ORF Transcript_3552/g.4460 Transcript_3552/m.4460 type:complete len:103 (-) Transcript_3552:682-990(-)
MPLSAKDAKIPSSTCWSMRFIAENSFLFSWDIEVVEGLMEYVVNTGTLFRSADTKVATRASRLTDGPEKYSSDIITNTKSTFSTASRASSNVIVLVSTDNFP